jgi:hypothetical protein
MRRFEYISISNMEIDLHIASNLFRPREVQKIATFGLNCAFLAQMAEMAGFMREVGDERSPE